MIVCGPQRPDVDPELARIDPEAASEWVGYVPSLQPPPVLAATLRAQGSPQLAEIVEAVEGDPRWGWLAVRSELLKALSGGMIGDGLSQQVEEWLRLKGVRIIDTARRVGRR